MCHDMKLASVKRWIYWVGAMLTVLAVPAYSQKENSGNTIEVSQFRMRETDDRGHRSWEIYGATAQVTGPSATLQDVRLTLFPKNNQDKPTVVTSPHATFHRDTRLIQSAAALSVEHPAFSLQRTGYDIFTEDQRMFIHKDVHMHIKSTDELLDKTRDTGTNGHTDAEPIEKD